MREVPVLTPVITPLTAPITATPGMELVHVPPVVVLVQVCDEPMQTGVVPVMVWEIGAVMVTVFVAVFTQPSMVTEYEITDVPAETPVTTPFDDPTVATAGASLDHVPPVVVLVQVCDDPVQTGVMPVMVCTTGAVTVTVFVPVLTQPPMVTE